MYMIWFINSARGSRFIVAPKVSAKTIKKKKCVLEFGLAVFIDINKHVGMYLQKEGISKRS